MIISEHAREREDGAGVSRHLIYSDNLKFIFNVFHFNGNVYIVSFTNILNMEWETVNYH